MIALFAVKRQVYACGWNGDYRVGLEEEKKQYLTPTLLTGFNDVEVVQIAVGQYFSVALSVTGEVWECGYVLRDEVVTRFRRIEYFVENNIKVVIRIFKFLIF